MARIRINVCDILFDNVNMNEALYMMEERIQYQEKDSTSLLLVANQDIINRVNKQKVIPFEKLNKAFLIIPDGNSIVLASKYLKTPLKERVAGPDLMEEFMGLSNVKGYSNFFIGGKDGVAEKMANKFKQEYPNLKVSGIYSPPFCDRFSDEENTKMIKMINDSGADVIWVSFGCPKQERWIIENCDKIKSPVVAGIGAAFDFHSGSLKRAPFWIRKIKMEWFYRFLQEPARLFQRYFAGGISFVKAVMRQKRNKNK
jgi:N-acetylglucosaminyldiphosphoundecaprenol N-acetyl-beta-D-mannosaminyltransferase